MKPDTSMPDDNMQDSIALYALDALEPSEALRVEQYLASNSNAREILAEHLAAAANLGLSVEQFEPPANLEAKILEHIRSSAQISNQKTIPNPIIVMPKVSPQQLRQPLQQWLLVASIAALVFLGTGLLQVLGLNQQLAKSQKMQLALEQLLQNPATRTIDIRSPDGKLIVGRAIVGQTIVGKAQALLVHSLGQAANGKTWQAWYIGKDDTAPKPLQTFGQNSVLVNVPENLVALAISEEPIGGSLSPTKVRGLGKL